MKARIPLCLLACRASIRNEDVFTNGERDFATAIDTGVDHLAVNELIIYYCPKHCLFHDAADIVRSDLKELVSTLRRRLAART